MTRSLLERSHDLARVGGLAAVAAVAGFALQHLLVLGPGGVAAQRSRVRELRPGESVLRVPHAVGAIVLDGDTDDPGWIAPGGAARTGPFVQESGAPARPYSDARLAWGDGHLYVALYAADEDIRSNVDQPDDPVWLGDSFRLVFARGGVEYAIDVSPRGVVTDAARAPGGVFDYTWNSGAHVSHEQDGTLNDPTDSDEEWVVEMAIPLRALGLRGQRGERLGFTARRCDESKNEPRVCAGWGEGERAGELVLD